MFKIISVVLGVTVLYVSAACAEDVSSEQIMQAEFQKNSKQVNEIYQEKIQKITSRAALPEEMRSLLVKQADEIRQFDMDMLQGKMDLKIRHAKERDQMKERLRKDAQNLLKWQLEEEERFQKNKAEREKADKAVLDGVKVDKTTKSDAVSQDAAQNKDSTEQAK